MPTMKGTVQEDDYRTEVQFKDKNLLKIKILASSGSHSTRICNTADSRLRSGPKSGSRAKIDGISPGAAPRIVAGSFPDCVTTNQDWEDQHMLLGPVLLGCLGQYK
jgi:hypothetical protein